MTSSINDKITISPPDHLSLGKQVEYEFNYNPNLLQGVPRKLGRDTIPFISSDSLPFSGEDTWTGYELSWLNSKGKPCVAILQCQVPITSENLIESKSFKLYLNSFNQTQFSSAEEVRTTLQKDLSQCAGDKVTVSLTLPHQFSQLKFAEFDGILLDDLDIAVDKYDPDTSFLFTATEHKEETLVSNLLKSNCLITSQPDWASIQIRYSGNAIDHEGLLKYLISFRQHNEFHEQCVERIYCDIMQHCQPQKLTVCARYTRRGGLDINPFRSNFEHPYPNYRQARQ